MGDSKMRGDQQRIYNLLEKVLGKLRDGHYGTDNNIDDLSLEEDLDEAVLG